MILQINHGLRRYHHPLQRERKDGWVGKWEFFLKLYCFKKMSYCSNIFVECGLKKTLLIRQLLNFTSGTLFSDVYGGDKVVVLVPISLVSVWFENKMRNSLWRISRRWRTHHRGWKVHHSVQWMAIELSMNGLGRRINIESLSLSKNHINLVTSLYNIFIIIQNPKNKTLK